MTLHVNDKTLASWRRKFGDRVDTEMEKAIKAVGEHEVGDSLDVWIIFQPTLDATDFSVKHDPPKRAGDVCVYLIAE